MAAEQQAHVRCVHSAKNGQRTRSQREGTISANMTTHRTSLCERNADSGRDSWRRRGSRHTRTLTGGAYATAVYSQGAASDSEP